MPRMVYKPEGAEPKDLDFDFGKLMSPERIVIEKAASRAYDRPVGWDECKRLFFENSTAIVAAFLFVMLKREDPTLRLSEFEICDDDFDLDLSDDEAREMLRALEQYEDPDDPEIVKARDELRLRFMDDDATSEGAEVTELPKAKRA